VAAEKVAVDAEGEGSLAVAAAAATVDDDIVVIVVVMWRVKD
jgi:hypothetical protein